MESPTDKCYWLVPWNPITGDAGFDTFSHELKREICSTHVLHGIETKSIAHRQDCDDVLFQLLDGSNRFALVHLTYAKSRETNPMFPHTSILNSWHDFVEIMHRDAEGFAD